MVVDYSLQTIRQLEEIFREQRLFRPFRIQRYEPGTVLQYEVKGVVPATPGRIKVEVERFVGGGYAGQVYRAKLLEADFSGPSPQGLDAGRSYALKILLPPKSFARIFRNFIYALGFQGPFSLQVNPSALRGGALWQKFLRRGAKLRLGSERAIADVFVTFVDPFLGSCGEFGEWVEGRPWRFEVDDNLFARKQRWKGGEKGERLGSPEYLAKRTFMKRLVELMHEMGAYELARQYEWWTFKSQPNVLKRLEDDPHPEKGLIAVDFRAGLALLPFLPMCPEDFRLIFRGMRQGSLVQFDRGDLKKLKSFVSEHEGDFSDLKESLPELEKEERSYRSSLPDISHHHLRLIYDRSLWSSIFLNFAISWRVRNIVDDKTLARLRENRLITFLFLILGLIPLFGPFIRKIGGNENYRRHLRARFTSFDYFRRSSRAWMAEVLIRWVRSGRMEDQRALRLASHPWRFFGHFFLSFLPPGLHRFLTDRIYFRKVLDNIFIRPVRLYFNAEAREKWLEEMISQGQKNGMLTSSEASRIHSQIKEPFIQKYLKSLAVHVCTLPVTQIVSVLLAIIYVKLHPELSWQQATVAAGLILGLFQVIPISPGSLTRGLYTTTLLLRERNFKDYNIAFFISFFKYIGYLAFPLQMAYRYPDLARFMAGHWATGVVHIVPVFGERGALLERIVFDAFYNYPLSLRRRIREKNERRLGLEPRFWHLPLIVLGGLMVFSFIDWFYWRVMGDFPVLKNIWGLGLWVPFFAAAAAAKWARGILTTKRLLFGIGCGAALGLSYALLNTSFPYLLAGNDPSVFTTGKFLGELAVKGLWQMFLFSLIGFIGAFLVEIKR